MSADVGDLFSGLASAFVYEDSLYSEEIESRGRLWPEDGILMARAPPRETRDIMSNGAKQTWPALAESQIATAIRQSHYAQKTQNNSLSH